MKKTSSKKPSSKRVAWRGIWAKKNGAESVRLFKAGKTVPEIAQHFGNDRSKANRVRHALVTAGVYRFKQAAKKTSKRKR